MYTINNAMATYQEAVKGSIEPGKYADLVVLTENILTCPVDAIQNIMAEMTLVNGKIVYQKLPDQTKPLPSIVNRQPTSTPANPFSGPAP